MNKPLVSIITVVRNGQDTIATTIESVTNQSYDNIEYVVIDGLSTDNTNHIIDSYKDRISYYISEADKGIADAWNKGIAACTGDLICILNSGDTLPVNYVDNVVKHVPIDRAIFAYPSCVKKINDSGKVIATIKQNFNQPHFTTGIGILHPGCFVTRKAMDLVGKFSLQYRIAIDSDWIFRCYRANVTFQKLDADCEMLAGGVSGVSNLAAYGEYLQAMRNSGSSPLQVYTSMFVMSIRGLGKSVLGKG
jgi:glycosyltransferase involved in cell wall biosynthesis